MAKTPEMPSDVEKLTLAVQDLSRRIQAEKDAKRWALRVVGVVLVVVLVGMGFLWRAYGDLDRQNTALVHARTDSRIVACQVDVNFATHHDALVKSVENMVSTVFSTVTANGSPQEQADARALVAQLNKPIDVNVIRVRKCDPASVAKFYGSDK